MNISKLAQLVKDCGKTKSKLAKDCGITRVTLDNALSGGDIRISILESIANGLGVPLSTFFDEEPQTQKAITNGDGNNVTQIGQINNSHIDARQYHSDSPDVLRSEIDKLDLIIAEKESRIAEKDKQIAEKDKQINALIAAISK